MTSSSRRVVLDTRTSPSVRTDRPSWWCSARWVWSTTGWPSPRPAGSVRGPRRSFPTWSSPRPPFAVSPRRCASSSRGFPPAPCRSVCCLRGGKKTRRRRYHYTTCDTSCTSHVFFFFFQEEIISEPDVDFLRLQKYSRENGTGIQVNRVILQITFVWISGKPKTY